MKQAFLILTAIFAFAVLTSAQTTAFNFQGRLNDGTSPANGRYDLEFRLYDGLTGDNVVGTAISKPNLMLVNGVFSTQLDFGAAAFSGANRFIEIRLRQTAVGNNPPNAFVVLGPRQQILAVPYAIRSLKATLADDATHAAQADNATTAANAANADKLNNLPSSSFVFQDANRNIIVNNAELAGNVSINSNLTVFGNTALKNTTISGNTAQPLGNYGLPKAMLKINGDGTIAKCYNGITGAETGNCGFTVDHFTTGGYGINFGFGTDASFVSLAVQYDRENSDFVAANYSTSAFFGHLDVYTFRFPNAFPTAPYDRPFTIILY